MLGNTVTCAVRRPANEHALFRRTAGSTTMPGFTLPPECGAPESGGSGPALGGDVFNRAGRRRSVGRGAVCRRTVRTARRGGRGRRSCGRAGGRRIRLQQNDQAVRLDAGEFGLGMLSGVDDVDEEMLLVAPATVNGRLSDAGDAGAMRCDREVGQWNVVLGQLHHRFRNRLFHGLASGPTVHGTIRRCTALSIRLVSFRPFARSAPVNVARPRSDSAPGQHPPAPDDLCLAQPFHRAPDPAVASAGGRGVWWNVLTMKRLRF